MVILETALIGAAGYGVYRGGEESARKAKQTKKEYNLQQKRRGQRNELSDKTKGRSERIAELATMRNNKHNSHMASQTSDTSWPLTSSSQSATTETSSNAVEDRQKLVMARLSNKPKQKSSRFNIFKKDKK
jgi:hypothetical protein